MLTPVPLIDRLAALPRLAKIPPAQLEWLASRGRVLRLEDGTVMHWKGDDPRGTLIILEGRLSSRTDRGGAVRVVRELEPGAISGHLPYSRLKTPSVYTVAVGSVELLLIDESDTLDMIRECHDFTALCVHEMVDRTRVFRHDDLHEEKMAALGRLAAGLAHELGNPSSAIGRSAGRLEEVQIELAEAARRLGATGIEGEAVSFLGSLGSAGGGGSSASLSALDLADREDAISDWLASRGVDDRCAYPLATADVGVSELEAAVAVLGPEQLGVALRFLAARIEARQLVDEIVVAAGRVHALIDAVKKHTHMDRAPVVEAISLGEHLAGTLSLLESKARAGSISVELDVEPDLPRVDGMVGDLNQVWLNLVDNAIEAAGESGRVSVSARRDGDSVLVDVVDGGPGVAPEHRDHIFDPFYTTKEVGAGAGLGLHVVRTVVESHRGSVEASFEPGPTRFSVRLPVGVRAGGVGEGGHPDRR
ncbi:MAG TPA: ATP-binding protein [Longimicrobiales bacterium]|nr:ATP-binding protein [Longimicrobiales bacterium]